ncbi:ABC transporter permease [Bordetella sp. 02P26C-1]|uniref:ABC transporter permease n=1 Tax=Bordetella sp. 02P26C-1 TaxID=2683195 RepID=UPI0013555505|nr:ABC transporter permease [Bordetella sp. 02P26C-1]MVW80731.1 ABC transporter permease subunit [Bordetella sp. 02P26C-1]
MSLPLISHAAPFSRSRSHIAAFLKAWPPMVLLSLAWLALMLIIACTADWLMPYGFSQIDLRARLQPPVFFGGDWSHPLGTDELGRDVYSRVLSAIQVSLMIAFASTLISTLLGVVLGMMAAHVRGWLESLVLMLIDFQAAMPFMIIALSVLAFFGSSLALFIVLMGFYGWERAARIARSMTITANEQGYAAAVHDLGASAWRVYGKHVLPNIAGTIIVNITITFPGVVLLESGLSFLGLGIQPPMASLGNMVGYGREYLQSAPWILLCPSLIIVLTTFSLSLLGDWLRDRLDPALR